MMIAWLWYFHKFTHRLLQMSCGSIIMLLLLLHEGRVSLSCQSSWLWTRWLIFFSPCHELDNFFYVSNYLFVYFLVSGYIWLSDKMIETKGWHQLVNFGKFVKVKKLSNCAGMSSCELQVMYWSHKWFYRRLIVLAYICSPLVPHAWIYV